MTISAVSNPSVQVDILYRPIGPNCADARRRGGGQSVHKPDCDCAGGGVAPQQITLPITVKVAAGAALKNAKREGAQSLASGPKLQGGTIATFPRINSKIRSPWQCQAGQLGPYPSDHDC